MPSRSASLRARNRADLVREIVAEGRRQLAVDGAAALSLRAVARELGMVSSAVYRYVASRDELLTLLIIDAYDAVADAVEKADANVDRDDLTGRWVAASQAVRTWAVAHPHEYALVYGSPVPGYRGNEQTTTAAVRLTTVLGSILRDGSTAVAGGSLAPGRWTTDSRPGDVLVADLRKLMSTPVFAFPDGAPADIDPALTMRGLMAWVQVFGLVSFELYGQFANAVHEVDAMFSHAVELMADDLFAPLAN
ncbi:MAG: TetR/AcrR family transcriptional regulator [Marmoricola sp.]